VGGRRLVERRALGERSPEWCDERREVVGLYALPVGGAGGAADVLVLVALLSWGDRWLGDEKATAVLVHAPCGTELHQAFWSPTCKCSFGPTAIRSA
jgi:hypothetical protein